VAEARAREALRAKPDDAKAEVLLASALLLQGELASSSERSARLVAAAAAATRAHDGGVRDATVLAVRGRALEALRPGSGQADLEAARRRDPRLLLLAAAP
jgi:hypothetical protein